MTKPAAPKVKKIAKGRNSAALDPTKQKAGTAMSTSDTNNPTKPDTPQKALEAALAAAAKVEQAADPRATTSTGATNAPNTGGNVVQGPAKWTANTPAQTTSAANQNGAASAPNKSSTKVTVAQPADLSPRGSTNSVITWTPEYPTPEMVDPLMAAILSTRRAHNSKGDMMFRSWLKDQLKACGTGCVMYDENIVVQQLSPEGATVPVLFSCHIDTVHGMLESDTLQPQKLMYDPTFGHIFLDKTSQSSCLGADDGAGIYIMLKMLQHKVPGTYIFHVGEERGGIGSKALAASKADWLKNHKIAVAFDRPNTTEVIRMQRGVVGASYTCAKALSEALNAFGLNYEPSDKGVYTDTAEYFGLIPECFNLGVGYTSQHTPSEILDYAHVEALLDACIQLDWQALPIQRDPTSWTPPFKGGGRHTGNGFRPVTYDEDFDGLDDLFAARDSHHSQAKNTGSKGKQQGKASASKHAANRSQAGFLDSGTLKERLEHFSHRELLALVREEPITAANVIQGLLIELTAEQQKYSMLVSLITEET